jgi:hypothetical protein
MGPFLFFVSSVVSPNPLISSLFGIQIFTITPISKISPPKEVAPPIRFVKIVCSCQILCLAMYVERFRAVALALPALCLCVK